MASIVTASGVSFEWPNGRELFNNLNFSLDHQLTALVGANGVGKTCLAQLLQGALAPTQGTIRRYQPIDFLPQRQVPPLQTVAEVLANGYTWSEVGERLIHGINREVSCAALSGGEWMRLRLACRLDDDFLILDEPTNDLDRAAREDLQHYLQGRRSGALIISHDRKMLEMCTTVLELSNRGLATHSGNWASYRAIQEAERKNLAQAVEVAKHQRDRIKRHEIDEREKQEKRNHRGAQMAARGGLPKILLSARKANAQVTSGKIDTATRERVDDALRHARQAYEEVKLEPVMYAQLVGQALAQPKRIAHAQDFNIQLGRWLYRQNLNFCWRGNFRVVIRGANGSGKSTLLRALAGEALPSRGHLWRSTLKPWVIDQRLNQLDDHRSVLDNVRKCTNLDESELRNGLAKFLFAKAAVLQPVAQLSGGERLRAALAQGLMRVQQPELLILDEVTNNLDLINIEFLAGLLRAYTGALVLVSHDDTFVQECGIVDELVL